LGWPVETVEVVSLVGRPIERLNVVVQPGRRLLVLSSGGGDPARIAELLTNRGYGRSELTVLERLGAAEENVCPPISADSADWLERICDSLNLVAVECQAEPSVLPFSRVPGLPDDAYENDGQLTKREIRSVVMALLSPVPGQLLWDVGAGAGSIAIEWMRTHFSCRAMAIERQPDRVQRLVKNSAALGVPDLVVVTGSAPEVLAELEKPDAIFVGGGSTVEGVIPACWQALRAGGRLVVNAVTVESEAVLAAARNEYGGGLTRIAVQRASPVGGFLGWKAAMPVTIWSVIKR
jgi:precorrin-6Y C5,15-methyltransferase (decarboxylating)